MAVRRKPIDFLKNIAYCFRLSFHTSKFYTLSRLGIQILKALLPLASVYISKVLLDVLAMGNHNIGQVFETFLGTIGIYLGIQVANHWTGKLDEYVQQVQDEMINNAVNLRVIQKASKVDLRFFDSPVYYDKLQWLKNNAMSINQMTWNMAECVSAAVTFIAAFLVMFEYSPLYSVVIVLSYIPIAVCDQIYIRKMYAWQVENVGEERKINYISDLVTRKNHAKNIRIFGIGGYLLDIYKGIWSSWFKNRKKIMKKWSMITLILGVVPQILTVLVLIQVGADILNGTQSIGDFSLYTGMMAQLVSSVFMIIFTIVRISENAIRVRDFQEFDHWKNEIEGTGEKELQEIQSIQLKDISFTYPGNQEPTLQHLSFEMEGKERLALVGVNGAGKTTLIKLLLRFYDVQQGEILINGKNIKTYTPESIRKQFSVMFQDYANYAFTIEENVRLSDINRPYTREKIMEAIEKSGAEGIVEEAPKGLSSYLFKEFDEHGQELSGGENQKIALARTFYRDAPIVILDEPSASLDPESEHILFQKMMELSRDKGTILITHRLSNVVLADRILVIENGRLVEDGNHEELIRKNGRYATLFHYQAEHYMRKSGGKEDAVDCSY